MPLPKFGLRPLPASLSLRDAPVLLATWFGSGLVKPASGTWGSLASLPFVVLVCMADSVMALLAFIILTFAVGMWATKTYLDKSDTDDPSEVVIDETCGLSISCVSYFILNIQNGHGQFVYFCLAFVLFRLFDTAKPWPVSWFDREIGGALGVMLDDVVAGILATAACYGLFLLFPVVMFR